MSQSLTGSSAAAATAATDAVDIVFDQIPGDWNVPGSYTEVQDVPAAGSLAAMPCRLLVVGQSNYAANIVTNNPSPAQASSLYGTGSALAQVVADITAAAPGLSFDVIAVAPSSGATQSTGSFAVSGTATASGQVAVSVMGQRFAVPVAAGATAASVAQAIVTAMGGTGLAPLDAATGCEASLNGSSVNLTTWEAGAIFNDIDLRVSALSSDQVPGITITTSGMANGTGAPSVQSALNIVSTIWYTDIVCTLNDPANLSTLVAEAQRRYGAMVNRDSHVWFGFRGASSAYQTLSATLNCQYMSGLPAYNPRWAPWRAAAIFAAVSAQSLNADPARQLRTLVLTGLEGLGPDPVDLYSDSERSVLLGLGGSTFTLDANGTVYLERVVTTYQIDPLSGVATQKPQDVMVPKTVTRVRWEWDTYIAQTYPRAKLADEGAPAAGSTGTVTVRTLAGSWSAQYTLYEAQGWLDDAGTYAAQAVFQRDATNRDRVNSQLPIMVMGSLIMLANVIQVQG